MNTANKHILVIILILIAHFGFSQSNDNPIYTDLDDTNLKGSPKVIVGKYERFYDRASIDKDKQSEYELRNDIDIREHPTGRWTFNPYGMVEERQSRFQDSIGFRPVDRRSNILFEFYYDSLDLKTKKSLQGIHSHPFPIIGPNRIVPNHGHVTFTNGKTTNPEVRMIKYDYVFNSSGDIAEELVISYDSLIRIRKKNHIDSQGHVIRQDMIFMEWLPPNRRLFDRVPLFELKMNIEIGINEEAYYQYEYDSLSRLTKSQLFENGQLLWSEQYEYSGNSTVPYKLIRFVIAGRTFGKQITNDTEEYYNKHGDIIKSENYDSEGKRVRTRFYDYSYDEHFNWIQCDMYLEGGEERTEKPTIIIYREIEYYTEEEVKEAWELLDEIKN
mgnify:CR=1 FL=1